MRFHDVSAHAHVLSPRQDFFHQDLPLIYHQHLLSTLSAQHPLPIPGPRICPTPSCHLSSSQFSELGSLGGVSASWDQWMTIAGFMKCMWGKDRGNNKCMCYVMLIERAVWSLTAVKARKSRNTSQWSSWWWDLVHGRHLRRSVCELDSSLASHSYRVPAQSLPTSILLITKLWQIRSPW